MLRDKADGFHEESKTRRNDYQDHVRLMEQTKEQKPKANDRFRRTRSFDQTQLSQQRQQVQERPSNTNGRHRRTGSHR